MPIQEAKNSRVAGVQVVPGRPAKEFRASHSIQAAYPVFPGRTPLPRELLTTLLLDFLNSCLSQAAPSIPSSSPHLP